MVAVLLTSSLAWGHSDVVLDPADTKGPLDLSGARHTDRDVRVVQSHPAQTWVVTRLVLKAITYEAWSKDVIAGGAHQFISFEFNLDRDQRIERCAVVTSVDGELRGKIYRDCNYFTYDEVAGLNHVSRPDRHSVKIDFRRAFLGPDVTSYRWRVATAFEDPDHPDCEPPEPHGDGGYGTCHDFTRWRRHSL